MPVYGCVHRHRCLYIPWNSLSSFALASELIALGADADAVARDVLYSVSAAHIRLLGIALSRMHIRETVAWSYITQNDLAAVDATDEDSEGTVTYLISIAGIHAAVFLRELPQEPDAEQRFRVSLRSKSTLDVSAIAATCGGGGHRNAAGCILTGDLHSNVTMLLRKVQEELSRPCNGRASMAAGLHPCPAWKSVSLSFGKQT